MVKSFLVFFSIIFALHHEAQAKAKTETAPPPQAAGSSPATAISPKSIVLSQKTVAELALSQGYRANQVNLQYQTYRLALAQTLSFYDWVLGADTGYKYDKSVGVLATGNSLLDNKYEQYITDFTITKPFTTGTLLGVSV
ncbi:MAG TPA: hypothetical protein VN132_08305, partial [Bdellovibrio sp.]|nr:hypothetical protein [Bdellovibrio sp.]